MAEGSNDHWERILLIDFRVHPSIGPFQKIYFAFCKMKIDLNEMLKLNEKMAEFNREQIPERVVHAKGAGAWGHFTMKNGIVADYCKASLFSRPGKKTPCLVRFSTVGGEKGSADTVRSPRGFAVKFFTEEGNWDLVCLNTPVFWFNDPIHFPEFVRAFTRDTVSHLKNPEAVWQFLLNHPDSMHQTLINFSDRGIPDGFRHMHGYSGHAFKLVNAQGSTLFAKFHLKSCQGIRNLTPERAQQLTAEDPDYAIRDLWQSIACGLFPKWEMSIQLMTLDQANRLAWNPFDTTKVWPQHEFPLLHVGQLTLDRNPADYFEEIERAAFSPSRLVPGIEFSPDKLLHGRIFAYPDTQFHRLGPNFMKLRPNKPRKNNDIAWEQQERKAKI